MVKDQFIKKLQNLDDIYYNGQESDVVVSDAEYDFRENMKRNMANGNT